MNTWVVGPMMDPTVETAAASVKSMGISLGSHLVEIRNYLLRGANNAPWTSPRPFVRPLGIGSAVAATGPGAHWTGPERRWQDK